MHVDTVVPGPVPDSNGCLGAHSQSIQHPAGHPGEGGESCSPHIVLVQCAAHMSVMNGGAGSTLDWYMLVQFRDENVQCSRWKLWIHVQWGFAKDVAVHIRHGQDRAAACFCDLTRCLLFR